MADESPPARDEHHEPAPLSIEAAAMRLQSESNAVLAAIVASSDDAILSKTLDGIVRTWNAGAQRIFGYTAEEMIGRSIETLLPPERRGEEAEILRRLRIGERVDHFETVRVCKDGTRIDVSVTISPVRDREGRIIGASKIARNITPQKQFERDLIEAKEQAESANRAKDRFMAVLSHELRTPLTPVLAAVSFMAEQPDLSADMAEQIDTIRRNVEVEARLIDDLLDLTRIVRQKVQLHFEVVDAHAVLRAAMETVRADIELKGIELSITLRAREHFIWADPSRLQQVFLNVLQNAVKFTPGDGHITVRTNNPNGTLTIQVIDSGIGIEAEALPRIFQAFEQGELTNSRQFGGLGLGLAIARSLIEMHHGTISAASEGRDRGATFQIDFKTVQASEMRPPAHPFMPATSIGGGGIGEPVGAESSARRILLVEDHVDTLRVLSKLLQSMGYKVRAVSSVKDALQAAEAETFELLISDIGLPDGSGNDIARQLLARKQQMHAIALSGFGLAEDLRRSHDAGFERHLIKPVNFKLLQDTIQQVLSSEAPN
jgi:two-component system CheB/CheR fusion protein